MDYFGVPPDKVVDVQALAGDSTDNVPGAPGIGVKTAAQLINEYGSLEALLERAGEIKQPKRRETLTKPETVELIRVSKQLVTLVRDVDLEVPLDALGLPKLEGEKLVAFLKAMEFTTITRRVGEICGIEPNIVEPDPAFVGPAGWRSRNGEAAAPPPEVAAPVPAAPKAAEEPTPQHLAAARAAQARAHGFDVSKYAAVRTLAELDAWIERAEAAGVVAFDTETTSLDPIRADLVGVSLAVAAGEACYIPINHVQGEGLFGDGRLPDQLDEADVIARLKPLLEARHVLKVGQNVKFDWHMFKQRGVEVFPFDDTMLMSYALDSGANNEGHGMDGLSERWLGHKPIAFSEVAGSGRSFIGFARAPIDKATAYAAEDADVTLRLWLTLKPRLVAEGLTTVYETLERPLVTTLARMEARGIAIDRNILSRLSGEFAQGMARIEAEIQSIVGGRSISARPSRSATCCSGRWGCPAARRRRRAHGQPTPACWRILAEEGHPLPRKILDWRQLSKLKSTYTDALPGYVNPNTHRVHTSFALASTTTGRLSSSEPNLQNIPIRNEEGRRIRRAFVAASGNKLISADYSQIELRLLAHIADLPSLKKAFADGLDIHAMTASEMFGVPIAGMPSEVRRRAKAINFGIIYGISAFGLANQLGIPREEAGAYIK